MLLTSMLTKKRPVTKSTAYSELMSVIVITYYKRDPR